jgi:AcrR family transcriptional regulator
MSDVIEPVSAQEQASTSRRHHILAAAAVCFARSGFHGTSMQEICQEAGMSPGALYRYFRSKDDIIIAIAEEERAQKLSIFGCDRAGLGFIDHLLHLGVCFLQEMAKPGEAALMAEVMAECLRNSRIGQAFKENEIASKSIFRDLLERAVASGEVEAPADFEMAMACLMAMGEGLVTRMAADPTLTIDRVEPLLRTVVTALFKPTAE